MPFSTPKVQDLPPKSGVFDIDEIKPVNKRGNRRSNAGGSESKSVTQVDISNRRKMHLNQDSKSGRRNPRRFLKKRDAERSIASARSEANAPRFPFGWTTKIWKRGRVSNVDATESWVELPIWQERSLVRNESAPLTT
eukprot:CAMPEP_0116830230 /NCGR_PEP_ID=MMETSP0418-20121206/4651_1 /TAXON_ID=1158023 /ORGANISM="Astrosyne radiata, Strain 13vi08-1A" /LENGTH=137 /DNA_ID=CAMNT_0004459317 /DNA_START=10 /DNA_END=423 /DNA_ORIENTATION=+